MYFLEIRTINFEEGTTDLLLYFLSNNLITETVTMQSQMKLYYFAEFEISLLTDKAEDIIDWTLMGILHAYII